jgi:hypothetical protein
MARYADGKNVEKVTYARFDSVMKPGDIPLDAGIYKCQNRFCEFEDVINRECAKLPPCSACGTESPGWKLLVEATGQ